jgi:hypothetical protein
MFDTHRTGWAAGELSPDHDPYHRTIRVSVDMTTPPDLSTPVLLQVGGRAKPIVMTDKEVTSLIDFLQQARRQSRTFGQCKVCGAENCGLPHERFRQ